MYRFILGADKQYDDKSKNSIAALIAENNQSEQDAIKNYEVLLSCLKDVGATDEQLAVSDVNYDGKVTIADALKIARYEVKLIDSL